MYVRITIKVCMFKRFVKMEVQYYLAARLIEEEEVRETRETSRRALQRKNWDPLDVSEKEFKKRYRLSKAAFVYLCRELCQKTSLKPSKRASVQLKVISALSFYATGSYQRLVGMAQYLGQTTTSKFINEVTDALISPAILNTMIKFPQTRAQRDLIKSKFYTKFGFPGVIGCIDGCHFHIVKPKNDSEHLYYCRKHFHSLNVQMICDSDCRILSVNAKFGGATHDAFIWEYSAANEYMQQLHNEHVWLLGDSGYPQRPWLMTPIPNAAGGSPEEKYTKLHGKARVVIENTFGRLKNRWRCLSKDRTLHYSPEKCAKIIMACSVLHNIALDFNVPDPGNLVNEQELTSTNIYEDNSNSDVLIRGRAVRSLIVDRINRLHVNP